MSEMNVQPPASALLPPAGSAATTLPPARDLRASGQNAARAIETNRPAPPTKVEKVEKADREKLETATQSVRDFVEPINSSIEFSVNDETGQLVVKIIDRSTKEVIRQMPSEEMLAIAKALDSIKGLFVTQTA